MPKNKGLKVDAAKLSDIGKVRDHNEDCADFYIPTDPQQQAHKGSLFIIADGMGGHKAGDVASQKAVNTINQYYYASPERDVRTALIQAIKAANSVVYQEAQARTTRTGMGTTVVAAVVRGNELYVANVGDSRAYIVRDNKIRQITEDHSWVWEQVKAGILTPEQARTHPQRNVLTRALGSNPDVEVDVFPPEKLRPGDIVVLCSDGLTEHVADEEIMRVVRRYPAQEAVRQLVGLANERGGRDNISVIVLKAKPVAEPKAVPAAPPRRRSLPLAPLAAGALAALLAVIVGGFMLWKALMGPGPSATPIPVAASPTPSPAMTSTTPVTVSPSHSPGAPPTATLAPTPTPTPTPPVHILPSTLRATSTPTPAPSPSPRYPRPVIENPPSECDRNAPFRWRWDGTLRSENHRFEIRFARDETMTDARGPMDVREYPTEPNCGENCYEVKLGDNIDNLNRFFGGSGDYWWAVYIVDTSRPGAPPLVRSEPARCHYTAPGGEGEEGKPTPPTH